jgi:radical SAM protein with 4Fe4S-binding SPASM domain
MKCTANTWISDREYLEAFNEKTTSLQIPLSGSIDLTSRCNLKCVHCYITRSNNQKAATSEINAEVLFRIMDQLAEAGCLYLLITGGEPLLRENFSSIYRHIKSKGILVSVFTNGTLINSGIQDLFEEFPPQVVEISIYGATAATYEKITGIKGSFKKCISGIQKLLDRNIRVKLKTVLMTINRHQFHDMERISNDFGVPFRFDTALFPCFDGNRRPISLRLPPEEAVELEFLNEKRRNDWQDFYTRYGNIPDLDTLYHCAAGVTSFHIDASGNLKPCLMVQNSAHNLLNKDFDSCWKSVISSIQGKKPKEDFSCTQCDTRMLCAYCPAFFQIENGSEEIPSAYLCETGRHRLRMIRKNHERRYHETTF